MRTSVAEQEAYQRVQALILVQDMVERIYANRANAADLRAGRHRVLRRSCAPTADR